MRNIVKITEEDPRLIFDLISSPRKADLVINNIGSKATVDILVILSKYYDINRILYNIFESTRYHIIIMALDNGIDKSKIINSEILEFIELYKKLK